VMEALFNHYARHLFATNRFVTPEMTWAMRDDLNISHSLYYKRLEGLPIGLVYNGTGHYRLLTDNPVKEWSICVYTPEDEKDKEEHKALLRSKGYKEGEGPVPHLWEWVECDGSVAHPEPCDSDRWELAYSHHMEGQTDQQEERSEDRQAWWEADDRLQRALSMVEGRVGSETAGAVEGEPVGA